MLGRRNGQATTRREDIYHSLHKHIMSHGSHSISTSLTVNQLRYPSQFGKNGTLENRLNIDGKNFEFTVWTVMGYNGLKWTAMGYDGMQ